jgi:hypothetical protein
LEDGTDLVMEESKLWMLGKLEKTEPMQINKT